MIENEIQMKRIKVWFRLVIKKKGFKIINRKADNSKYFQPNNLTYQHHNHQTPQPTIFIGLQPTQMSTHSQQQTQIMQTCQRINTLLQIPSEHFSLEALTHIDWYIIVLSLIYPQLKPQFQQIRHIKDQPSAIDSLLFMLTKEQIIEEDFLEIKGRDIVEGDVESVYYVVQLLNALIERQGEESEQQNQQQGEQGQEQENEQQQENESAHQHSEPNPNPSANSQPQSQQQYSNDFQQPLQSNTPTPQKPSLPPAHHLPKPTNSTSHNHQQMFKNVFNHYDSQDQPSRQQERHSVLGIRNQFEDDQQEEEDYQAEDEKVGQQFSSGAKTGNNATFGQQGGQGQSYHANQHQQQTKPSTNQANSFLPSKPQHQPTSTNYKQTQPPKKQFPSSSSQQPNFYQQPSKLLKQNPSTNNNYKKISKPSKQQTQQEDDNQYFINPTIKKYKSDAKFLKTAGSMSKKSTTKKNLAKYLSPTAAAKQSRKLISHPTIKKHYLKATDPFSKKLTQQVKTQASTILKKKIKKPLLTTSANPTNLQMQRKAKQMKVKLADWKKDSKIMEKRKLKSSTNQAKSSIELTKVLNWRQGQLKREKQVFQKAMEMKLQVQKQAYIKKINTLLIKLQKQKQLHQRQQYKQHLLHQNHEAAKRLTAIEQWYKDRIAMLKESNSSNRNQRKLMHTGHKEILKHIEKELKRENQKQIMAITMKYRKQEAQVQNDLEELEREIIKVYKSH